MIEQAAWPAPRAEQPVRARVSLPGSKSQTNRALLLAALADGPSRVVNPLRARDTELMADALRSLGVQVALAGTDWLITPAPLHGGTIDTGLAGTVMRFVPPLAALADGAVTFDGDERARERPMSTLLDGLRQAGAVIEDAGGGRLPFTVRGTGSVAGGPVKIDTSASSQFVSGLLLAAPRFEHGIVLHHVGAGPVPSAPHIEMTLAMLADAGARVSQPDSTTWVVEPGPIRAQDVVIEPDLSNAAPFLAAALVTDGSVTVADWPRRTTQPGDAIRELLVQMGGEVSRSGPDLVVRGTGRITALEADLHDVSELMTVLAALAALADGPSRLTGLAHTRGHETDRLAALTAELRRVGATVEEHPDGLTITPAALHGALWHSYADHRMATAGAVLGLAVDDLLVEDIATTAKTLPDFPARWAELLTAGE